MKKNTLITLAVIIVAAVIFIFFQSRQSPATADRSLKVGVAPYQDMALLMNANRANLEKKYNLHIEYSTLPWENLTPAISSAGSTMDLTFASLTEFTINERNINKNTSDPLVYIYPTYMFLGGSFVSFKPDMPVITQADLNDPAKIKAFLKHSFAAEANSQYEQMLFILAQKAGVDFKTVKISYLGLTDSLLAAENGSIDATEAGLTQRNEAMSKGGKVVIDSATLNSVDVSGFVVKQSTLAAKRSEIEDFIRVWYDSTNYVLSDLDHNSAESITYLDKQSATQYTVDSFKAALSHEVFPRSIDDVNKLILNSGAQYDFDQIKNNLIAFELQNKIITESPQNISIIDIATSTAQ